MGRLGSNKPALTAVVASLLLLANCGGNGGATVQPSPPTPPAQQVRELSLQENQEAQLTIEDQPDWMTSGFGSIWVTRDEAAAVDRIDPESNKVASTVQVGDHPCNGAVAAFGSVWVPSCSEQVLYRVDPKTENAEKIEIPIFQPTSGQLGHKLAAGAGAIWMMTNIEEQNAEFTALARIDPRTNNISDVIPLGHAGTGVAATDDAVWIAAPDDGVLVRVDPAAKVVEAEIEGLSAPNFVAADNDAVWVLSGTKTDRTPGDGSVVRIDPSTNQVTARIRVDERAGQAGDIVVGEGAVWVRTQFTLLAKIDPASNRLVERYTDQKGLGGVVADFGSVWLSDFTFNQVWRVPA